MRPSTSHRPVSFRSPPPGTPGRGKKRRRGCVLPALIGLAAAGCQAPPDEPARPPAVASGAPTADWRRAVSARIDHDARQPFRHRPSGALVLNRAALRAVADPTGFRLLPQAGPAAATWSLRLRPTALVGPGWRRPLTGGRMTAAAAAVRVRYAQGLVHLLDNGPRALEQRYRVDDAPGPRFAIAARIDGPLDWRLAGGRLEAYRGRRLLLTASAPRAFDAGGRELEARFARRGDELLLWVAGARRYPVTIDPAWEAVAEPQSGAWLGWSATGAGDVNGDGHPDVLVAAPYFHTGNPSAGKIYLYYGTADGLRTEPGWSSSGDNANRALFGWSVAAGDTDGDGYSDLIVGAPSRPDTGDTIGKAFCFRGSFNGPLTPPAWTSTGAGQAGAFFGTAVAAAGDVNGDGYGDAIVGAPAASLTGDGSAAPGSAYLFHGSAAGLEPAAAWSASGEGQPGAGFGWSAAGGGDIDGDGYDDVLIGAHRYDLAGNDTGRAYLYRGSAGGLQAEPAWSESGDAQPGAQFGWSVAVGAIDADGFADGLVGAPGHDTLHAGAGRCYAYRGGNAGSGLQPSYWWVASGGDVAGAQFGWSVALAGDVDADGYGETLVGAPADATAGSGAGRIFLYSGSPAGPREPAGFTSTGDAAAGAGFGGTVAAAGDVNGDGAADFLASAYLADTGEPGAGKVFLFLGTPGGGPAVCEPEGAPCDDGDDCTHPDTCDADGVCRGTPFSCDDDNPCTDDVCRPDGSCDHLHNSAPCDDGDPCTEDDRCRAAACRGDPKDCSWLDDGCKVGACDPASGQCRPQPAPDGTACDDGDPCTADERCVGGTCIHQRYVCDRGGGCATRPLGPGAGCWLALLWLAWARRRRATHPRPHRAA